MITNTLLILFAYLLGSLASAIIVCRLMGREDPRQGGSGNPGATNVLRLHGKPAAILTLAGDVLKGVIPVVIARLYEAPDQIVAATGLAAFIGHLYPIFFGFRGGKGVATLIGVLLASSWLVGLAFIVTWLCMALLTRYSSLAALIATVMTPLYTWLLLGGYSYIAGFSLMAMLLIWRHRSNIRNLLDGTERRLGARRE